MITRDGKKERQTPEANEKMKNELPQVGFEPTTLYTLDALNQLSYQGSPAGRLQIKPLVHL